MTGLCEDLRHRLMLLDAGEPLVETLGPERQAIVVDAQDVHDRGVQHANRTVRCGA